MKPKGRIRRVMLIWPHRAGLALCPFFHVPRHEDHECCEMVAPGHWIREDDESAQRMAERMYGRIAREKDKV